jgi:hypothetical protein
LTGLLLRVRPAAAKAQCRIFQGALACFSQEIRKVPEVKAAFSSLPVTRGLSRCAWMT